MLLCGFAFAGGGAVLLTGCSTSQSESGREILSEPSEDENSGNLDNGDKNDGNNGNDDSSDDDVEGNGTTTQQFTLRNYTFTSTTGHSGNTTQGAKGGCFTAYWRASDNNSKNLADFYDKNYEGEFSNVTQGYFNGEVTEPGGGTGNNYIGKISHATYYHSWWWLIDTNKQNRYVEIRPYDDDDYEFFGVCEQGNESSMRTVKSIAARYYFFGNNDTTYAGDYNYLSKNTSYLDQNFNLLGSVVFRKKYTIDYYSTSSSLYSSSTQYAGIGFNLRSSISRTGYTFAGWKETSGGGTIFDAGYYFEDSWSDSDKTFVAQWIPNTYTVSYGLNGGSGVTSNQVRYSDTYGKSNLYVANTRGDLDGLSNNIFTINYTNSTSGIVCRNFFQPFDRTYASNTKYTAVIEVLSYSGSSFHLRLASPNEGGTN